MDCIVNQKYNIIYLVLDGLRIDFDISFSISYSVDMYI